MPNIFELLAGPDSKNKAIKNRIAKRLHDERKTHGYNQEELGNKIGCSRQRVASWEVGWNDEKSYPKHLPEIDHLVKLCSLYECEPGYLLCEYDEKRRTLTDVSNTTGLYPASISILQEILEDGLPHAKAFNLPSFETAELAFANYLISNISRFNEALLSSVLSAYMIQLDEKFANDPNSEIIARSYFKSITTYKEDFKYPHPSDRTDTHYIENSFYHQLIENFQEVGYKYNEAIAASRDALRYYRLLFYTGPLEPEIDKHHFLFELTKVAEEFIDNCYSHIEETNSFLTKKAEYLSFLSDNDIDYRPRDINSETEKN